MALYKIVRTSVIEGPAGAFSDDPLEPMIPAEMLKAMNAAVTAKQFAHHHLGDIPGVNLECEDCGPDCDCVSDIVRQVADAAKGSLFTVLLTDEIQAVQFAPTEVTCHGCRGSHRMHNDWGKIADAAGNGWHGWSPCCDGTGLHHYEPSR